MSDAENASRGHNPQAAHKIVLVTGPSGAGRYTAVKAMEDIGFEAIDNLPLSMFPRLLDGPPISRPMALGIDVRNRDFSTDALVALIDQLSAAETVDVQVLYLDCSADVLLRRFSETRRRHPLAAAQSPMEAVQSEFDLLRPVRARANILIDTTELSPHDLRAEIERWFDSTAEQRLAVALQSFSYKRGIPHGVDLVLDCRFLRNPYWEQDLRPFNGQNPKVGAYIQADPRFDSFFTKVHELVAFLLPAYAEEGKSHLAIAFGCTGGQHRSVFVAEKLANALAASGWQVSKRHRELERHSTAQLIPDGLIGE